MFRICECRHVQKEARRCQMSQAGNKTVAEAFSIIYVDWFNELRLNSPFGAQHCACLGEADSSLVLQQQHNKTGIICFFRLGFMGPRAAGANVLLSDELENWTWLITRPAGVEMGRPDPGPLGICSLQFHFMV